MWLIKLQLETSHNTNSYLFPASELSIERSRDLHPIMRNIGPDKTLLLFEFCRSKHFSLNEQYICRLSVFF